MPCGGLLSRGWIGLPKDSLSDRLSPIDPAISIYSGGTVRDSHPVILFSFPGSSPEKATQWVIKLSKIL